MKDKVATRPDFGNGIFSEVMGQSFDAFQEHLGFSPEQSERVARAVGADAGKLGFKLNLKAGKLVGKHDGKISLRVFSDSIKTTITPALNLFKITELFAESRKYGVKNTRDVELSPTLMAFVNKEPTHAGMSGAQRLETEAAAPVSQ